MSTLASNEPARKQRVTAQRVSSHDEQLNM